MINMDVGWCIMLPDNWIVIEYMLLHLSFIPLLPRQVAKKLTDEPGIILMSFFLLSLTMRISFYSYDTIIQYPHYLYSAGWNGLKWIITKRNIGMRLAQIFPTYIFCLYEYMLNVEWGKGKIDIASIIFDVYIFFYPLNEILDWLCFLSIFTKPFSISTYSFSYIYWILTFIP